MPSITIAHPHDGPVAPYADGPRLLADIGGTHARFALARAPGRIDSIRVLRCADYPDLVAAIAAYVDACGQPLPRHAAIAIANPVRGDEIRMTNHHWRFSIEATRRRLNLEVLLLVNDFSALAMALPQLGSHDTRQVGGGTARAGATIGLVGAGTGLGVGGLIASGRDWHALDSEGGHVSFSPADERELAVLEYCWRNHAHVSAERLVSGPGIATIYRALAARRGSPGDADRPDTPGIVERALAGTDPLCRETLECFCAMLGTVASDVALTLGALGGLYIGGGVVPRLGEFFADSPFRARFENKGRFSQYLSEIPTFVITSDCPALVGVARILSERLDGAGAGCKAGMSRVIY